MKNIHLILFMTKKKILEEYGEIYKEYLNDDENAYNDFKKHGYYTQNVELFFDIFSYCKLLSSIDLSNLNIDNVEDMSHMFDGLNL